MPITTSWVQESTIRLLHYEGVVTAEEIETILDREIQYLDSAPSQIYLILDMQNVEKLVANPVKIPAILTMMKHPNVAYTIHITDHSGVKFWLQVATKILGIRPMVAVMSLDEAINFAYRQILLSEPVFASERTT